MLSKMYKILFFINLLLFAGQSYSASPPPLPSLPPLPKEETSPLDSVNASNTNLSNQSQELSIFDKIKQFFYKPEKPLTESSTTQTKIVEKDTLAQDKVAAIDNTISPKAPESDTADSFMDIGNMKLPSITALDNKSDNDALKSEEAVPAQTKIVEKDTLAQDKVAAIDNTTSPKAPESEAADSFMDISNMKLPSITAFDNKSDNDALKSEEAVPAQTKIVEKDTLAQNKVAAIDNTTSPKAPESEAADSFMDIGNMKLPSITALDNKSDNDSLKPKPTQENTTKAEYNNTNLASNNIRNAQVPMAVTNVAEPLISMPPLRAGSPAPPPQRPVQIYQVPDIPHINDNVIALPEDAAHAPDSLPAKPALTESSVNQPISSVAVPVADSPAGDSAKSGNADVPAPKPPVTTPTQPDTSPKPVPVIPPASSSADTPLESNIAAKAAKENKDSWDAPLQPVKVVAADQTPAPDNIVKVINTNPANNQVSQKAVTTIIKPANEISQNNQGAATAHEGSKTEVSMSAAATKFAKDETQMLFLPDDDIVLGKLTKQAKLEQMDMYSYIKLFQQKEEWIANSTRRKMVKDLIRYDNELDRKQEISALYPREAIKNAFKAVDENNIFALRALIDAYPILQDKGQDGDTLLTAAAYKNNYYLAKFLVIRGIKISALNGECRNAVDVALDQKNYNIACMLTKARGW